MSHPVGPKSYNKSKVQSAFTPNAKVSAVRTAKGTSKGMPVSTPKRVHHNKKANASGHPKAKA